MKKHFLKPLLAFGFVCFVSIAHALVFPQETHAILIDFHDFEKEGSLYYRQEVSLEKREELKQLIRLSEARVADFWGSKTAKPKYIYCESEEDLATFGSPALPVALTHMKLGSYIIISDNGVDLDIISHEISHTELFERVGFFNRLKKIPTWFDEGLAMQVDHRTYYGLDTLKARTDNLRDLPDVTKMNSYPEFAAGGRQQLMINYATAKYEVSKWHSKQKLHRFVQAINNGESFQEAYSDGGQNL